MYTWILLHVCLFSPTGIIMFNTHVLSVSMYLKQGHYYSMRLLHCIQIWQLLSPANNAIRASKNDDSAPYTCCAHCSCFTAPSTVQILHSLLQTYVAFTCCGKMLHLFAVDTYMLYPLAVDVLLLLLWSALNHHCGILSTACAPVLNFHCHGSVQSTLPATDSRVI